MVAVQGLNGWRCIDVFVVALRGEVATARRTVMRGVSGCICGGGREKERFHWSSRKEL